MPVAGEKAHAFGVAPHQHSEAIMLDLVQPPSPNGRLVGWAGQAGLAEVGEGDATQQNGARKKAERRCRSRDEWRSARRRADYLSHERAGPGERVAFVASAR